MCEHWEGRDGEDPFTFKIQPTEDTVTIDTTSKSNSSMNLVTKITSVKILKLGVLSNIAITGHKLEGMTKDAIIVVQNDNRTRNWIYVVLSRVRKRSGLFYIRN